MEQRLNVWTAVQQQRRTNVLQQKRFLEGDIQSEPQLRYERKKN